MGFFGGGGSDNSGFDVTPYVESMLDRGENMYDSPLFRPAMNSYQQGALTGTARLAGLGENFQGGADVLDRGQQWSGNILGGHGLGSWGQEALSTLTYDPSSSDWGANLMGAGGANPYASHLAGLTGQRADPSMLQQTARGDFLHGGAGYNAAEESIRQRMPGIVSNYAGMGREGSGLAATAAAREATNVYAGVNQQERQNQLGAQQYLMDDFYRGMGNDAQIAQGLMGDFRQGDALRAQASQYGLGQQFAGANQMMGNHMQGLNLQHGVAGMSPNFAVADYTPYGQLKGAGDYTESHERNRQEEDWQRYERYMASNSPLFGGIQGTNGTNDGLGVGQGAMAGAAMGTAIMPGWGTALGGVAGGLLGAFS